jgi:hypothetical protein
LWVEQKKGENQIVGIPGFTSTNIHCKRDLEVLLTIPVKKLFKNIQIICDRLFVKVACVKKIKNVG